MANRAWVAAPPVRILPASWTLGGRSEGRAEPTGPVQWAGVTATTVSRSPARPNRFWRCSPVGPSEPPAPYHSTVSSILRVHLKEWVVGDQVLPPMVVGESVKLGLGLELLRVLCLVMPPCRLFGQ